MSDVYTRIKLDGTWYVLETEFLAHIRPMEKEVKELKAEIDRLQQYNDATALRAKLEKATWAIRAIRDMNGNPKYLNIVQFCEDQLKELEK